VEVLWKGRREGDVELRACPFGNIPLAATQCGGTRGQGFALQPHSLQRNPENKLYYPEWRQSLQGCSSRQSSQCPIHSGLDMARRALHLHLHEPWGSRLSRGHLAQKLHRGLTTDHPTTMHQHCLRLCSSPGSQHPVLLYNQIGISLLRYQPNHSLPGWAIPYPVTITPCLHGIGVAQCNPSPLSSIQHHASRFLNKTKATESLNLRSASKRGIRGSGQGCGETCTAPYMPCRCDVPATRPFEHPGSVARWRCHGNPLHVGGVGAAFSSQNLVFFHISPH
jgi:hypothetical protein